MPRFRDIPQFTRAVHESDHGGGHLEKTIAEYDIDLEPIYQREHVWTTEQQIAYVEFRLRGGEGGSSLYFNYIIGDPVKRRIEIVDGKQRITAARLFMADKLPAFGYTLSQYADRFPAMDASTRFRFHINDLQTKAEVIQWYIALNYAGTPHTEEERARVKRLLEEAK